MARAGVPRRLGPLRSGVPTGFALGAHTVHTSLRLDRTAGLVTGMDTSPRPHPNLHLHGALDGRPVDCAALLAAVWDGAILDLNRADVTLGRRPYLSETDEPVPEELAGYAPVSSKSVRKGRA